MMESNYIKRKLQSSNYFTVSGIEVHIKVPVVSDFSVRSVVEKVIKTLPKHLLSNINKIMLGQFEELNRRKIVAMYKDSTIFVTNIQKSEEDLLDDLIHEVAHSVEEIYGEYLYSDGEIEREFLHKRKSLWLELENRGFEMNLEKFLQSEYDEEFDMFLYKAVGYKLLSSISSKHFYSPYAATSLREYFANGFEAFYMREDIDRIKKISPILYYKIINIPEA